MAKMWSNTGETSWDWDTSGFGAEPEAWRRTKYWAHVLGYEQANKCSQLTWDSIEEGQGARGFSAAFCEELEFIVSVWRRRYPVTNPSMNLLDAICRQAQVDSLPLPRYALLAIFRLRCSVLQDLRP